MKWMRAVLIASWSVSVAAQADEVPLVVVGREAPVLDHVGAVLADPTDRKAYVGVLTRDERRTGLYVFDVDADGRVVGRPRRYSDHPDSLPAGHHSTIVCFHRDAARRRLYWGVRASHPTQQRSLVSVALDERGEPTGTPEAFDHGNPHKALDGLAVHPTNGMLYAVGWGGEGVFALQREADGRLRSPAKFFRTGGYGGLDVAVRADGRKLYRGTYPSTLEVCDLDERGEVAGTPRAYSIPGGKQEYLRFTATDRAIFVRDADGKLAWFALDGAGEPVGELRRSDLPDVQGVAGGTRPERLLVATASRFTDAVTGKSVVGGMQLRELALNPDGSPGATVRASVPRERTESMLLAGGALPVVAAKSSGRGFLGNRIAGLEVRCSLVSLEVEGTLLPAATTVKAGDEASYLRFAWSEKFGFAYAAVDGRLVRIDPRRSPPEVAAVPCGPTTGVVAIDEVRGRAYVGLRDGSIERHELAKSGAVAPDGERFATGLASLGSLVVHPTTGVIYAIGAPAEGKAAARPDVVPVPAGSHVADATLDVRRGRLYVVAAYQGRENTTVWKLRPAGTLAAPEPLRLADGIPYEAAAARGTLSAVRVDSARRKLYVVGSRENPPEGERAYVVVRDLDEHGDPIGPPRPLATPNPRGSCWSLDLSADGSTLYESGWGEPRVYVHPVDERGEPGPAKLDWLVGSQGKRQLTVAGGGALLLAGTYPSTLEIVRLETPTRPAPAVEATITVDALRKPLGQLAVGQSSPWTPLDEALAGGVGDSVVRCTLGGARVKRAVVRWQVAQRSPRGVLRELRDVEATIEGAVAALVVPKYGLDDPATLVERIRTSAEEFARYRTIARRYGLSPEERPQRFTIANGLIGLDASPEALEAGAEVLGLLGHNAVQAWSWGGVRGATIREAAERHGLRKFRDAVYAPPTYFDYQVDEARPESLDRWAAKFRDSVASMGGRPEELTLLHMADEPGWYYPASLDEVRKSPERLAVFREYLRSKGLNPQDVGATRWEDVVPGRPTGATTLAGKRLLFWTARFYAESMSRAFQQATLALRRQVNPQLLTTTNLNNWPGRFYIRSPGRKYANNADAGPDAAMGMPDWFDLGRKRAVSCLWTEDWFGDSESQLWSLYGDLLRCAAREGELEYGGYAVGHSTGALPDGAKYKILSLVGHGAKTIDPYTFGPNLAFADGWSEKEATYRNLAAAMRLLAKSERLLAPGRPRAGSVAIVFPQASQVWDAESAPNAYLQELYGLHAALVHENYGVDFVDDGGIEAGDVERRGYAAVYVTAPNLSLAAQRRLHAWVEAGGVLVLAPGACAADEYDEPTDELRKRVAGTQPAVPRVAPPHFSQAYRIARRPIADALAAENGAAGRGEAPFAIGQVVPWTAAGAKVLGRFDAASESSGATSPATTAKTPPQEIGAAVVESPVGRGRIVVFGYWPGVTYWLSCDRSDVERLPADWSASARSLATYGARVARAPRPVVTSVPGVEACRLDSAEGTAVVLLNWTGRPIERLQVRLVGLEGTGRAIASAERGALVASRSADGETTVELPLESVDVLLSDR